MKAAVKKQTAPEPAVVATGAPALQPDRLLVQRHLRAGWWGLLVFLTLGIVLELLHGFKSGYYLNVSNHTRRLMWTLAHAHGTLLGLINIAFAATLQHLTQLSPAHRKICSLLLIAALVLLPAGFFLGGLVIYSGDPGFPILLVPLGAIFLWMAVFFIARRA